MNKSHKYLENLQIIWNSPIPEKVMDRARCSLLDYIAVTCAGAEFQKFKLKKYYEFAQPENGIFNVIGSGKKLALKEAVFLNGLNAHALDYDDGTNSGIIHLGAPIFSLLIPLAQRYDTTVDEMLRAVIIGYEASYTMAISIQPTHKAMGFHATGTCGTLGAVIAASYMLGFSEEERFHAFASACVAASGMLKALDDGSELKPYNVAKASLMALTSLQMAKAGFTGPTDPLSGRGFLKMMTGQDEVELQPALKNGTYAIMKSYTKPYASCRYTHPAVEAAIHLRNKVDITNIRKIIVNTYDLAVLGHDHTEIQGSYSAKMSIPYSVVAGLIHGEAGLKEFSEETVKDRGMLELAKKVIVYADNELSKAFPDKQTAVVSIITDERVVSERVDFPKGEPENPMTRDEFRNRYDALMKYACLDIKVSNEIYESVYREDTKVNDLVRGL